jgi:hypothetical protein
MFSCLSLYHLVWWQIVLRMFVVHQNPDTISTNFASTIRRAKMRHVRFHDLWHTHATQLLKAGVHPKIICERLGLSKIGLGYRDLDGSLERFRH